MPKDDLTFVEKSVLLILMAEAIERLPNTELTNKHRVKPSVVSRQKLENLGFVKTKFENRRLYWEVTDLGWKRGFEELGAELPPSAGTGGSALYATLEAIKRFLDRNNVPYSDFYQRTEDADALHPLVPETTSLTPGAVQARIRKAYGQLAGLRGEWVSLADLRDRLVDLPRDVVDASLVTMSRAANVNIVPESNQKALTQRDRDAAVIIGNQYKHAISIGS